MRRRCRETWDSEWCVHFLLPGSRRPWAERSDPETSSVGGCRSFHLPSTTTWLNPRKGINIRFYFCLSGTSWPGAQSVTPGCKSCSTPAVCSAPGDAASSITHLAGSASTWKCKTPQGFITRYTASIYSLLLCVCRLLRNHVNDSNLNNTQWIFWVWLMTLKAPPTWWYYHGMIRLHPALAFYHNAPEKLIYNNAK